VGKTSPMLAAGSHFAVNPHGRGEDSRASRQSLTFRG